MVTVTSQLHRSAVAALSGESAPFAFEPMSRLSRQTRKRQARRGPMRTLITAASVAAICVVDGATGINAKGKYLCKPAMIGFGKDEANHKAKSIAD
jgi:hypothetical protein